MCSSKPHIPFLSQRKHTRRHTYQNTHICESRGAYTQTCHGHTHKDTHRDKCGHPPIAGCTHTHTRLYWDVHTHTHIRAGMYTHRAHTHVGTYAHARTGTRAPRPPCILGKTYTPIREHNTRVYTYHIREHTRRHPHNTLLWTHKLGGQQESKRRTEVV